MLKVWHFMKGWVALLGLVILMTGCSGSSPDPTTTPSPLPETKASPTATNEPLSIEDSTPSPDSMTSQEVVIDRVVFIQSSAAAPA